MSLTLRGLQRVGISVVLACASSHAAAGVALRVESRPIIQPIDAYVLVTDAGVGVLDLTKSDFSVTLDGAPLAEFELFSPPRQDPTQQVSVVLVMQTSSIFSGDPFHYAAVLDALEIGDYVSVVKYWGDIEWSRLGGMSVLAFTRIDGGDGSQVLRDFIEEDPTFSASGRPYFQFEALLAGMGLFQTPAVNLPEGPRAILTTSEGGGRQSLSDVIAAANAESIPLFNAGYASWDQYPDWLAQSTSLAANTGGVRIPVVEIENFAGAFTSMAAWLEDGYRITIPQGIITDCNPHMLEVTVRGEGSSMPFVRCDTTPDRFSFADLRDVAVGTIVVSDAVTITGIETAVPVSVIDGQYSIGCGSNFTRESGWISPGDSVCLRHMTAAEAGREASTLLIIDGESAWFESSTLFPAQPPPPPPPPPDDLVDNAGGGGPLGITEALLLLALLLARSCAKKGFQPAGVAVLAFIIGFATLPARAATGDLDPSFADHGRRSLIPHAYGEARSIELLESGGILVGGGRSFVYSDSPSPRPSCRVFVDNFVRKLHKHGNLDTAFGRETIDSVESYDLARQADGSVIAAGRKITGDHRQCRISSTNLAVYRLGVDGSLDTSFGTNGVFQWFDGGISAASSLALEPDGRIVVAGGGSVANGDENGSALVVLRLLANGDLDKTFGIEGVYINPIASSGGQIVRTRAGSYRVSAAGADGYVIVGLTPTGILDPAFGDDGVVAVSAAAGSPVHCQSFALLSNDKLVVAGSDSGGVFAARLLANGTQDPAFTADAALTDSMTHATSIIAAGKGKVLVAGRGDNGTSIMRLLASGERDTQFGDDGRTWIDLRSDYPSAPVVNDLAVRKDGSVVAVGSDKKVEPFVVELIGDKGGVGPGIVGFVENHASMLESDGRAVLRVRRRGGSDGNVSVRYQTRAVDQATAGQDFTARTGTLHWADGDTLEREIFIRVMQDDGPAEGLESFGVTLGTLEGAGIGARLATVEIQPDGSPAGQVHFYAYPSITKEGRVGRFMLKRDYYYSGRICVTLRPKSGTARAGQDFDADASTVCWEDGDKRNKLVQIAIIDDSEQEGEESFTVELSNPTGGAQIGWLGSITVPIVASDQPATSPPPPPPVDDSNSGGGGLAGVAELLVLLCLLLAGPGVRQARARSIRGMGVASPVLLAALCLSAPLAEAATGDLDPSFADHGRLSVIPGAEGTARSVEVLEDGRIFIGGGDLDARRSPDWLDVCSHSANGFTRLLTDGGVVDSSIDFAHVRNVEALAATRQPDGRTVAVGGDFGPRGLCGMSFQLVVYRLASNGLRDASFAANGVFRWRRAGREARGDSIVLEPDGRVVVAGIGPPDSRLVVLRLLSDGTLDRGFGNGGVYTGPQVKLSGDVRIVRLGTGGYRVAGTTLSGCVIIALTPEGARDVAYGRRGFAGVRSPDRNEVSCSALEALEDGALLVAGHDANGTFVRRLLANGTPDPTFATGVALTKSMTTLTAVASAPNGKVLVAGWGNEGAVIMRLRATGTPDARFGDNGRTRIELASKSGSIPFVRDMAVQADGTVIAVGGDSRSDRPFVVRLLGTRGGAAPGVVGVSPNNNVVRAQEADRQATIRIQRTGGSDGAVSVGYRTVADGKATAGADFTVASGTLHWADGDASEREIVLDVIEDRGPAEAHESFHVVLEDAQGGAGIGTRKSTVQILPDGFPGGQIIVDDATSYENYDVVQLALWRDYYDDGDVCVQWRTRPGTAKSNDFEMGRSTQCWSHGDDDTKYVQIRITNDGRRERNETFFVELTNATGGAVIGPQRQATVTILDDD